MLITTKHFRKYPKKMRTLLPLKAISEHILPDYLRAYQTFICNYRESAKICVETMIVPPAYEQVQIINQMKEIASITDISDFEGAIMRLLLVHDTYTIDALVQNIQIYNNAKKMIDLIMDHVQEINLTFEQISQIS
jgi:hypothetical protein